MKWCVLKGTLGDAPNVILSACCQNLRKLLRWLYFAPNRLSLLLTILLNELLNKLKLDLNNVALQALNAIFHDRTIHLSILTLCR